jgi:hypothetical protein
MVDHAGPVGLVVNPQAGRDIRRVLAPVALVPRTVKLQLVQRVVLGAVGAGAGEFLYLDEPHGLVGAALAELGGDWVAHPAGSPVTGQWSDTVAASAAMRDKGCAVVVTLGGDGTNRAAALGWPDLPVVAVSTGTNNAFPRLVDPTAAGAAAGLIATGAVGLTEAADRVGVLEVAAAGRRDLALVDVVLVDVPFVGSGAFWDPDRVIAAVVRRPDPAAMGMAGLAGVALGAGAPALYRFGPAGRRLRAPLVAGRFATVRVTEARPLRPAERPRWRGPAAVALDGERTWMLAGDEEVEVAVKAGGPWLVDVGRALALGAARGVFWSDAG